MTKGCPGMSAISETISHIMFAGKSLIAEGAGYFLMACNPALLAIPAALSIW